MNEITIRDFINSVNFDGPLMFGTAVDAIPKALNAALEDSGLALKNFRFRFSRRGGGATLGLDLHCEVDKTHPFAASKGVGLYGTGRASIQIATMKKERTDAGNIVTAIIPESNVQHFRLIDQMRSMAMEAEGRAEETFQKAVFIEKTFADANLSPETQKQLFEAFRTVSHLVHNAGDGHSGWESSPFNPDIRAGLISKIALSDGHRVAEELECQRSYTWGELTFHLTKWLRSYFNTIVEPIATVSFDGKDWSITLFGMKKKAQRRYESLLGDIGCANEAVQLNEEGVSLSSKAGEQILRKYVLPAKIAQGKLSVSEDGIVLNG